MFQTLWFFIKLFIAAALAIWLVTQEGDVDINMMGYSLSMPTGIFLLFILTSFIVTLTLYRLVRGILNAPKKMVAYTQASQRKKSFRALTRGLVAVAAGDAKQATHYSKQTKNLWPDLKGLPLLLEAQAAQLRGETGLAQNRFERMLADNDSAFLGVRGLMNEALKNNDYARALDFARKAEKQHPKKPWVVKGVYDLEIKNRQWRDALRTNHKLNKLKIYDKDKITSDRIAIYLHHHDKALKAGDEKAALSEVEKAYKLDPNFVPTVTRYCRYLIQNGQHKKVVRLIEKSWKNQTHPDLADLWIKLAPEPKGKNPDKDQAKKIEWVERLLDLQPNSATAQIMAAKVAMEFNLWGEAKAYLNRAEKIYPSVEVYRLLTFVEQNSTHNEEAIHHLMERASRALPDKVWMCQETGIIYDEWSAIAKPHGAFNSIIWDVPGAQVLKRTHNVIDVADSPLLIDPAA